MLLPLVYKNTVLYWTLWVLLSSPPIMSTSTYRTKATILYPSVLPHTGSTLYMVKMITPMLQTHYGKCLTLYTGRWLLNNAA